MDPKKKKKLMELYQKSSKPEEIFGDVLEHMSKLEEKVNEMAEVVLDIVSKDDVKPKEGIHGRDGNDGPRGPKGPAGSPDTAEMIRDKIASLKGKAKLSVLDLKDLEWLRTQQNGNVIGQQARFITLADAPNSYVGKALMGVRVNAAENGVEFYTTGGGGSGYLYDEVPAGAIDGVNANFALAHLPTSPAVMIVQLNGAIQSQLSGDYSVLGTIITFSTPPSAGSTLEVYYS